MILVNKTVYQTEELRKLLSLVHEHMAKREGRLAGWGRGWGSKKHTINVKVTYSRSRHVTGCATLNGFDSDLRLPKVQARHCSYRNFIWLAYHEMMHLYGYNHPQFIDIQDEEITEILSATGHTLFESLPITINPEGNVKVKISGTSYAALDLKGIEVESTKEVKRGKGIVVVIEASPESAKEILARLQAKDKPDSGLSYEARYACRIDAKRLDKQLSQAEEAAPATEASPAASE